MHRPALLLLAALAAAGCASVKKPAESALAVGRSAAALGESAGAAAMRQASGPHLSPIAPPQTAPSAAEPAFAPNSLWRAGSRTFFNDQRASRIGDILTVRIDIDDSGQLRNSSSRSRNGSTNVGVSNLFGAESSLGRAFGGGFDPAAMIDANGASEQSGLGAINRTEKIALTVAATIVDVLPNGNLVIAGRQEVRLNAEQRELDVAGIIRPEDIAADNTIRHAQIAEARISYGGRGQVSAVQRPRIGQRIADAVAPW
jgi:flagellar L-ring protein precursor FlgH